MLYMTGCNRWMDMSYKHKRKQINGRVEIQKKTLLFIVWQLCTDQLLFRIEIRN